MIYIVVLPHAIYTGWKSSPKYMRASTTSGSPFTTSKCHFLRNPGLAASLGPGVTYQKTMKVLHCGTKLFRIRIVNTIMICVS